MFFINLKFCFIEDTEEVKYAMLKSPSRFESLKIYVYTSIPIALILLYEVFLKCRNDRVQKYGQAYHKYNHLI